MKVRQLSIDALQCFLEAKSEIVMFVAKSKNSLLAKCRGDHELMKFRMEDPELKGAFAEMERACFEIDQIINAIKHHPKDQVVTICHVQSAHTTTKRMGVRKLRYRGILVVFQGCLFDVTGVSADNAGQLVRAYWERQQRRLRLQLSEVQPTNSFHRTPIPAKVRMDVWQRDKGTCVRCGSRERLEFDHIIPVSRGGSNTARNIELLCERCNRSKHTGL